MNEARGDTDRQLLPVETAGKDASDAARAAAALVALWEYAEARDLPARDGGEHSPTARRVLLTVQRVGPTSPGELCRALGITPAAASRACARLTSAGLLERRPDPDDRRRTVLALAPEGLRSLEEWRLERARVFEAHLRGTPRQHQALRAALGALTDRISAAARAVRHSE